MKGWWDSVRDTISSPTPPAASSDTAPYHLERHWSAAINTKKKIISYKSISLDTTGCYVWHCFLIPPRWSAVINLKKIYLPLQKFATFLHYIPLCGLLKIWKCVLDDLLVLLRPTKYHRESWILWNDNVIKFHCYRLLTVVPNIFQCSTVLCSRKVYHTNSTIYIVKVQMYISVKCSELLCSNI